MPLQAAERAMDGALDVPGAGGQGLEAQPVRLVAEGLQEPHQLVHELDLVVSGRILLLRTHLTAQNIMGASGVGQPARGGTSWS
jgi:hypothetical protein